MGLVDGHAQVGQRVLRLVGQGRGGHAPTGGHDLDDVDAVLGVVVHGGGDRVGVVSLAAQEPAVSAGGGDRWTGREDGRSGVGAAGRLGPDRQGQVVPVAEVSGGGDPAGEHRPRGLTHVRQECLLGRRLNMGNDLLRSVEDQVGVRVDQARQQRGLVEVEHRQVVRRGRSRGVDVADPAVLDHDHRVRGLVE